MTETMKQFARDREVGWLEFGVDGDVLRATTVCPGMAMLDIASLNEAQGTERVRIVMGFLDQVLDDESCALVTERLRSKTNPLEIDQLASVAVWLVEEVYAKERPTQAPSPSQNGSGSTGPSTTGTASTEGSTPGPSTRRVL